MGISGGLLSRFSGALWWASKSSSALQNSQEFRWYLTSVRSSEGSVLKRKDSRILDEGQAAVFLNESEIVFVPFIFHPGSNTRASSFDENSNQNRLLH